jgi:hypothetical protein
VNRPSRVVFTAHGEDKAQQLHQSLVDVAEAVLSNHERRQRNPGEADWIVTGSGLVVVYNWPDRDDQTAARVVSLWRAQ